MKKAAVKRRGAIGQGELDYDLLHLDEWITLGNN
jgi:hypothetical protein